MREGSSGCDLENHGAVAIAVSLSLFYDTHHHSYRLSALCYVTAALCKGERSLTFLLSVKWQILHVSDVNSMTNCTNGGGAREQLEEHTPYARNLKNDVL